MKRFLAILAAPALLVVGCGTTGATNGSAPEPSKAVRTAPESSEAVRSAPGPSEAAENALESSKASQSTTGAGGGPARCHTADLDVTTGVGGAAAGTHSINLLFTNKTGKTCSLYGYPGVSWVAGDNGTQVNAAFAREPGETAAKTITVRPGAKAYVLLLWPYYANCDSAKCRPAQVRGYRVYPPDETAAIFVSDQQTVCAAPGVGTGRVRPVAAAAK
ncbi:DUF4232 domain-containing protein [Paractinoplanes lichenicola]|uniref:DUF4232 domain-containing protein n=1 Tax=Paractinoplanes lichenicola TaxID=2802976 RepID=A0ABS1VVU3_9ACTN|nr:DUF4232 domain-containing protein [Actinoplanes lichenicola]MBL7258606.1 DUF4232 domain-containing protein [Actinoplanes lichenicola]